MLDCTDCRGIKIDNQYLKEEEEKLFALNVSNTTFTTEEKSAILVKSTKGAIIALSEVNIAEVAADLTNSIWVDSATAEYENLIEVPDGKKIEEP